MTVRRIAENCHLVHDLGVEFPGAVAQRLMSGPLHPGVEEVVAAYETLAVYGNPAPGWENWLLDAVPGESTAGKLHQIPVWYEGGLDTAEVCQRLGLSLEEVIARHTGTTYRVYAVGFQPGFAYLGYLPPELSALPRRDVPRPRVPAGAVGIALDQTAVYPQPTPGGWHLIGQCPLVLVDVAENYFPIQAGDEVRFHRISVDEYQRLEGQRL